jgi:NAD(P)-dependent dehydrogenase (short-subunit alcohol dehydrogenase family)
MADSLDGKVAIVTGGGSGIGEALSVELGRRGALVTVADIRKDDAERVAALIAANGGKAQAQIVDVAVEQDVRGLIEETAVTHGRLDYVFNNAGIAIGGDARDLTLDQWRQVLDVNLYGVLYGTFAAYPIMVKQGYGSIVNTASAAGLVPLPMVGAYTTAKHAVVGFSRALRLEAAGLGVQVSVVCPGWVRTRIFEHSITVNLPDELKTPQRVAMIEPDRAAREILEGVARNREIIIFPAMIRRLWRLHFFLPGVVYRRMLHRISEARKQRIEPGAGM